MLFRVHPWLILFRVHPWLILVRVHPWLILVRIDPRLPFGEQLLGDEGGAERVAIAVAAEPGHLVAPILHEYEVALRMQRNGYRVPGRGDGLAASHEERAIGGQQQAS